MATGYPSLMELYKMMLAAEKLLVTDTENALVDFIAKIEALAAEFPAEARNAPAVEFVNRILQSAQSFKNFDLPSVKQRYGIADTTVTP